MIVVYFGCQRISEERDADNGKDGGVYPIFETNRSGGEKDAEIIGLEEMKIGDVKKWQSVGPEKYVGCLNCSAGGWCKRRGNMETGVVWFFDMESILKILEAIQTVC